MPVTPTARNDSQTTPPVSLPRTPARLAVALLSRLALFTLLWWILSGGRWSELAVIAVVIFVSAVSSLLLWPVGSWRWRPLAVLAFIPWFLWQSLCGGFDVAWRALQMRPSLQPRVVCMTIDLPENAACLFAWILSLLPGTACVHIEGDRFRIHLLDEVSLPKVDELRRRVARLLHEPATTVAS